ncbi:hypothetical protein PABG_11241 [Paracoccidioides brasiliensis Pb03]|nr:hypothetical protein PABG_11241 [Paracoccidioides brasiliensis Pb03]
MEPQFQRHTGLAPNLQASYGVVQHIKVYFDVTSICTRSGALNAMLMTPHLLTKTRDIPKKTL